MAGSIPLNCLRSGERAVVEYVLGQGDAAHRLHEMGLRAGAQLELLHSGSPCIVRLNGQRLCLRTDEWMNVLVRLESGTAKCEESALPPAQTVIETVPGVQAIPCVKAAT